MGRRLYELVTDRAEIRRNILMLDSLSRQYLLLVEKQLDGTSTTKRTLPVSFVPLKRDRAK